MHTIEHLSVRNYELGFNRFILRKISVYLSLIVIWFVFTGSSRGVLKQFGQPPEPAEMQIRAQNSIYKEGRFYNTIPTANGDAQEMWMLTKRYLNRDVQKEPAGDVNFNVKNELLLRDTGMLHLNWMGHSSVLMEKKGMYILTDPVFDRASPVSFAGPDRMFPSPISEEEMPDLEAVIISHDHYDHLSMHTVKNLEPKTKFFVVPLGVGSHLRFWGIPPEKVVELDWYEKFEFDDIVITSTPARHFTGRGFTNNNTLWASIVIEFNGCNVYFGGDSGIFPGYEEIGEDFGPFDICLMPIGAYDSAWHDLHLFPEEAVDAFEMLGGGLFYPIHWGTIDLAPHSWYDPIKRLIRNLPDSYKRLVTAAPGAWVEAFPNPNNHDWWFQYVQGHNFNTIIDDDDEVDDASDTR